MKVLRVDEEIIANSYRIFPHVFCVFIKLKELPGLKLAKAIFMRQILQQILLYQKIRI